MACPVGGYQKNKDDRLDNRLKYPAVFNYKKLCIYLLDFWNITSVYVLVFFSDLDSRIVDMLNMCFLFHGALRHQYINSVTWGYKRELLKGTSFTKGVI